MTDKKAPWLAPGPVAGMSEMKTELPRKARLEMLAKIMRDVTDRYGKFRLCGEE